MRPLPIVLAVVAALLALAGPAVADGVQIGWGSNCWYSGNDTDNDSLNQSCENALAYWFGPQLRFGTAEDAKARRPYFSVKSMSFSTKRVRIFYMPAYYRDTGFNGHDGDSEFIIIDAIWSGSGDTWYLEAMFTSAHYGTGLCDSSGWWYYDEVEYIWPYRGYPRVHVAEKKHANYNDDWNCDGGACGADNCNNGSNEWLEADSWRNAGNSGGQLVDRVEIYEGTCTRREFLWSTYDWSGQYANFCGWRRCLQGTYDPSRNGCSTRYRKHLDAFGM